MLVGAKRHGLSDAEWRRLQPMMPPRPHTGRPPKSHRLVVDALLWLGRTGAPWRDLPERFGPWRTVATRFYRWTRSGLWERVLAELRRFADSKGGIDWEVHMVDGTSVRAHRSAVGAKRMARPVGKWFVSDGPSSLRKRIRPPGRALGQDGDPRGPVLLRGTASERHFCA
jgi:transposase